MDTICEYRSELSNSSSEECDTIPEPGVGWDEDLRKVILSSSVQADLDPRLVSWLREWDLKCSPPTDIRDIIEQDLDSIFPKGGFDGTSPDRAHRNKNNRVKDKVSVKVAVEQNGVKLSKKKSRRCKRSSNRVNRTGLRIQQYAIIQNLYKKNRKSCFRKVVSGSWKMVQEGSALSSLDEQTSFWAPLLEGVSNGRIEVGGDECDPLYEMVKPITEDELERTLRRLYNGAPGPDRIKKSGIQSLSKERLSTRFNFYMLVGISPLRFKRGTTVLIPKTSHAEQPKDFRPITLGSVVGRLFHKILAYRLDLWSRLSIRQKAFRKFDGIAENLFILKAILEDSKQSLKDVNVIFLDVAKAFDTVTHQQIVRCAMKCGVPRPLLKYIADCYSGSSTRLRIGKEHSRLIKVGRGVRQGDPMSPVLFNCVIDNVFRNLGKDIGVSVGGVLLNCLAFADDLVLLAQTKEGAALLLSRVETSMMEAGLNLNSSKSASMSIKVSQKRRKWFCDPKSYLKTASGECIKALEIDETYKYLGVEIGLELRGENVYERLEQALVNLTNAPLKPQQRIFMLLNNLLPSLNHLLMLGVSYKQTWIKLNYLVRRFVRRWLNLPKDVPMGFFYASNDNGGFGFQCFTDTIPILRGNRRAGLLGSSDPVTKALTTLSTDLRKSTVIERSGIECTSLKMVKDAWGKELVSKYDGRGMKDASILGFVNSWMVDGTSLMRGNAYIGALSLKFNSCQTKSRMKRYYSLSSNRCDACNSTETLGHILQSCSKTHYARLRRHDSIVKYLEKELVKKEYTVLVEPRIKTIVGLRKPDLVFWKTDLGVVWVVDVSIVADNFSLENPHIEKVNYYSKECITSWAKAESRMSNVLVSACILNWRGTLSKTSYDELLPIGWSKRVWMIMSVRVLEKGRWIYDEFRKSTRRSAQWRQPDPD